MDREHLEARLREIAASADATKTAAEALLRELQATPEEGGGVGTRRPREEHAAASKSDVDRPTGLPGTDAAAQPDEAAARLVAMKLALDGTPREQAIERLAEEFGLGDPTALVGEVYERAGK